VATAGVRNWGVSLSAYQVTDAEARRDSDGLDAELLAAALADRTQFGPLYHRYRLDVYSYCRRRLDEQDAEDVTSHIFLQALGHLESCRGPCFRAWLFRIAHNAVIDRLRAKKPSITLDETLNLASSERSPETHALDSDLKHRLEAAIRALPPDQRAAVELRLAGLTGIECADVLCKSPEAVRMLQHRAFVTLRTTLGDFSPGTQS
jgi:RNA polymerase sigma-70 factor (ECF subfamily)